jgi:O-antigen/teichoic acid export membrane protein
VLAVLSWPLTNAGIGRAAAPEQSLAAWPVALSALWLFATPLQMLQQLTIAQVSDAPSRRSVRRFALGLGAAASGLLALVAFTPLLDLLLLGVLAVPREVEDLVSLTVRLLTPVPFLTAIQGFFQGLLIGRERTVAVRTAMTANLLLLVGVLAVGIRLSSVPGSLLAAFALTVGLLVEAGLLGWRAGDRLFSRQSHEPQPAQDRFTHRP